MRRISLKGNSPKIDKKVEKVLAETVVHRNPFIINEGVWPFVVFGPDSKGQSVIRVGTAEQMKIHTSPVYIATLGGPHIPDADGVPIEELSEDDVPEELHGLKVFHVSPMRPISVSEKKGGPPIKDALSEIRDFYKDEGTALIETPDESYWILSVLKYLDESDRFFPDQVLMDFNSRLGRSHPNQRNQNNLIH